MEDTEMLDQQLPQASLVDTGVQQQQSSHPIEGQHTTGTRHSPHSGTADDNTLTLPTDVNMSDKPDNKSSNDADTNSCDAAPGQPLEKKNNGDAAPFPCAESFTPKSGPKHVEKSKSWLLDPEMGEADEAGTQEEQAAFMKELESFYKNRSLEFKHPKFYGEPLNCLKLWRAVIRLGGYEVLIIREGRGKRK